MNKKHLLILHGWGSNSNRWEKVKILLGGKGIEVLILDLPGFGITPSPKEIWSRDDYINWVFKKVKEKNWERFNLLGHSFGGGLSVKMAVLFPEKIEKLILCAPALIRRKSIKTYLFYWLAFFGKKIFSLPGFDFFYPYAQKLIYRIIGSRDYYLAEGVMKEIMKRLAKEDLEDLVKKIRIPTLIVWGEKDDVLPVKDAYQIKEQIKHSEIKVIPRVRHGPHREVPEQLAEIVFQYL